MCDCYGIDLFAPLGSVPAVAMCRLHMEEPSGTQKVHVRQDRHGPLVCPVARHLCPVDGFEHLGFIFLSSTLESELL